jgi:hypothetical protein
MRSLQSYHRRPSRGGSANIKLARTSRLGNLTAICGVFENGVRLRRGRQALRLATRWISRASSTRTFFHSEARMADSGLLGGFAA